MKIINMELNGMNRKRRRETELWRPHNTLEKMMSEVAKQTDQEATKSEDRN